jgi:hypothetical protein
MEIEVNPGRDTSDTARNTGNSCAGPKSNSWEALNAVEDAENVGPLTVPEAISTIRLFGPVAGIVYVPLPAPLNVTFPDVL